MFYKLHIINGTCRIKIIISTCTESKNVINIQFVVIRRFLLRNRSYPTSLICNISAIPIRYIKRIFYMRSVNQERVACIR